MDALHKALTRWAGPAITVTMYTNSSSDEEVTVDFRPYVPRAKLPLPDTCPYAPHLVRNYGDGIPCISFAKPAAVRALTF